MEGTLSVENYNNRHIEVFIEDKKVSGSVTAENSNPRFIELEAHNNVLKGAITSVDSLDRNINLTLSRSDLKAIRLVLFCLFLDMRIRQGFLGTSQTSLNLNTNLNLP